MAPANSEQRETTVVPPHPVLDQYYARPDDRQGSWRTCSTAAPATTTGSGPCSTWARAVVSPRCPAAGRAAQGHAAARRRCRHRPHDARGRRHRRQEQRRGRRPESGHAREARKAVTAPLVRGRAEALPFRGDRFDMLSMGFALRHVPDLGSRSASTSCPEAGRAHHPARDTSSDHAGGALVRQDPFPARPAVDGADHLPERAGPAPHEVLLGHDRSVCAAGDDPRRAAEDRLRRRQASADVRADQRVHGHQALK